MPPELSKFGVKLAALIDGEFFRTGMGNLLPVAPGSARDISTPRACCTQSAHTLRL